MPTRVFLPRTAAAAAHPSQAEALVAAWRQLQAAAMEENVELAEEEYPYEAVSRMQAHLEDELSVVIEHLQVRA